MLRLNTTCELLRMPFKASWSLPVNNSVTDVEKKFVLNLYDNSLVLLFDKSDCAGLEFTCREYCYCCNWPQQSWALRFVANFLILHRNHAFYM